MSGRRQTSLIMERLITRKSRDIMQDHLFSFLLDTLILLIQCINKKKIMRERDRERKWKNVDSKIFVKRIMNATRFVRPLIKTLLKFEECLYGKLQLFLFMMLMATSNF